MADKVIIKKKKVSGGHAHHGGAWKVAYADFVTAMMALFMVMWLLASTEQAAKKQISNYFRTGILPDGEMAPKGAQLKPSIIEAAPYPPPPNSIMDDEADRVQEAIKQLAAIDPQLSDVAEQLTVQVTPEGVVVEIVDRESDGGVLFDVASSDLKPALVKFLKRIAPTLKKSGRDIQVIGHSDARPFAAGNQKNNWVLSFERADAARVILEQSGLAGRLTGIKAHGDSQLIDKKNPLSARNRRLAILIVGKERKGAMERALERALERDKEKE